ncbi:hypothetical protein [Pedobacter nototheniae]|uniref:hypothetical protein n=1 Tax=Pedobacter nototheniae TaxID=2488994 RepID=UPI00293076A7|nr:hypothetical protein [Pedobacter nototheniae]
MKTKLLNSLMFFLIISVFVNKSKAQPAQNLNISFLLDLSDRIDPKKNPNHYQRDLQYIRLVEKAFVNHVKGKKIMLLKDQMQIFFDPIPEITNIDQLSQELKVSFNPKTNKKDILNVDKVYTEIPQKIYQHAIKDGHYIGSDIWKFFKNNVQQYCIKPEYRNILIILTDGYIYHKNNKIMVGNKSSYITSSFIEAKKLTTADYQSIIKKNNLGFISFPYNLKELEIIVLGINPSDKNPYEEDVIKQFWTDWFKTMNVKKFYLQTTDLPSRVEPVIQQIIRN